MDLVATLSNEHGLIRQYLDNLTMAADRIERSHKIVVDMGSILSHLQ